MKSSMITAVGLCLAALPGSLRAADTVDFDVPSVCRANAGVNMVCANPSHMSGPHTLGIADFSDYYVVAVKNHTSVVQSYRAIAFGALCPTPATGLIPANPGQTIYFTFPTANVLSATPKRSTILIQSANTTTMWFDVRAPSVENN